jgi:3-hydroxyisobutyrate dehydrogenase-like beta-hydroxyacid dehydrogenase
MDIGIAGLGIMGRNAALKLQEHGFTVRGYDVSPRAAEWAAKEGVSLAASLEDVASVSELVLIFVPGPRETETVITGDKGLMRRARPGLVIVNMSTVDPDVNIRMDKALAAMGAGIIDAPVLGRPAGVGAWAFPVGGDKNHVDAAMPALTALGGSPANVFHVGPLGDGNKLKLLNNMMFGAINACAAEIMALAEHMGLSQKLLLDVAVAAGAGTVSSLYKEIGTRSAGSGYDAPTFTVDMLIKDNHLCLEMARKHGLPMMVGNAVDSLNRLASLHGLGAEDNASMWKMVAASWNRKS